MRPDITAVAVPTITSVSAPMRHDNATRYYGGGCADYYVGECDAIMRRWLRWLLRRWVRRCDTICGMIVTCNLVEPHCVRSIMHITYNNFDFIDRVRTIFRLDSNRSNLNRPPLETRSKLAAPIRNRSRLDKSTLELDRLENFRSSSSLIE